MSDEDDRSLHLLWHSQPKIDASCTFTANSCTIRIGSTESLITQRKEDKIEQNLAM